MTEEKMNIVKFEKVTDEELTLIVGGKASIQGQLIANEISNSVSYWSGQLSLALSSEYFYY